MVHWSHDGNEGVPGVEVRGENVGGRLRSAESTGRCGDGYAGGSGQTSALGAGLTEPGFPGVARFPCVAREVARGELRGASALLVLGHIEVGVCGPCLAAGQRRSAAVGPASSGALPGLLSQVAAPGHSGSGVSGSGGSGSGSVAALGAGSSQPATAPCPGHSSQRQRAARPRPVAALCAGSSSQLQRPVPDRSASSSELLRRSRSVARSASVAPTSSSAQPRPVAARYPGGPGRSRHPAPVAPANWSALPRPFQPAAARGPGQPQRAAPLAPVSGSRSCAVSSPGRPVLLGPGSCPSRST
jgi:hypothetical protein